MNGSSRVLGSCLIAMAASLGAGAAVAQNSDSSRVYSVAGDNTRVSVPGEDKNGDGCIDRSEVTPGSQLEKRFDTRDTNGDGKLCRDEYYRP